MSGTIDYKCQTPKALTGRGDCIKQEGKTLHLLITGTKAYYPVDAEEFNTGFSAEAEGYIYRNDYLNITPINDVAVTANNGGDIATTDVGYGNTEPTGFNGFSQTYRVKGGVCLAKELMKLNRKEVRVFRVDDENACFGTIVTKDNVEHFAGFKAVLMVRTINATGTDTYYIELSVYYTPNYELEIKNAHMIMLNGVPVGLTGAILQNSDAEGEAKVVNSCSTEDITDVFGTSWDTTMFQLASGTAPTTVVYDPDKRVITLSPVGSYRVMSADVLVAGGIEGIEGINQFVSIT